MVDKKVLMTLVILVGLFVISMTSFASATIQCCANNSNIVVNWTSPSTNGSAHSRTNTSVTFTFTIANASALDSCIATLDNWATNTSYNSSDTLSMGDGTTTTLVANLSEGETQMMVACNSSDGLNSTSWTGGGTNLTTYAVSNIQSLAFVSSVKPAHANLSATVVQANFSFQSCVAGNITVTLTNVSGQNYTISDFSVRNCSRTLNGTFAGLVTDSNYTINITIRDNMTGAIGSNYSIKRKFTLDDTNPTASYTCTDPDIFVGESTTCTCTVNDKVAGINYTSYTSNPTTTTSATNNKLTCTTRDRAGNELAVYTYLNISQSEGGAPAGDTGGGGTTHVVDEATFESDDGITQDLQENDQFKITFTPSGAASTETHTVAVSSVGSDSIVITISSDPITVEVMVGEEVKVDIDEDGTYDIYVKLNAITDGKADITTMKIEEEVPEGQGAVSGGTMVEEGTQAGEQEEPMNLTWLWWLLGVIVVVIIIAVAISAAKKKK